MNTEIRLLTNIYLFPFSYVRQHEEIAIYGFGKIGRQYYEQLATNGYCKVRYIIDRNCDHITCDDVSVLGVDDFLQCDFNGPIVISINKGCKQIKQYLIEKGISSERIIDYHMKLPISIDDIFLDTETIDYYRAMRELLQRKELLGKHGYCRVGNLNDGGYVMADCFKGEIAYSFGIADDVSWDKAMADKGYDVYMYDHTIDVLPMTKEPRFHYFHLGISDVTDNNLDTLENIIRKNKHEKQYHMVLKIDVEGDEWKVLNSIDYDTIRHFDQIVMELHDMFIVDNRRLESIKNVSKTHQIIHVHANNYSPVYVIDNIPFADVIEITWALKDNYVFGESTQTLPRKEDSPNCKMLEDISLKNWY